MEPNGCENWDNRDSQLATRDTEREVELAAERHLRGLKQLVTLTSDQVSPNRSHLLGLQVTSYLARIVSAMRDTVGGVVDGVHQ